MSPRILASVPLALTVGMLTGCAPAPEDEATTEAPRATRPSSGFEVGQPFPAVSFPGLEDGEPRSVADFKGEKLILHVFASW